MFTPFTDNTTARQATSIINTKSQTCIWNRSVNLIKPPFIKLHQQYTCLLHYKHTHLQWHYIRVDSVEYSTGLVYIGVHET